METVRDILDAKDRAIRSIQPEARVFDALKLMSEMEIGAVMVLDESASMAETNDLDFLILSDHGGLAALVAEYATNLLSIPLSDGTPLYVKGKWCLL